MKKIKNIIFDLGGIFIELSYDKTQQAFEDMGVKHFHELFTQHHSSPLFADLETGRIGESEFYEGFRTLIGYELTDQQIKDGWNAMLLHFHAERLEWLENISKKYKIYLFSNTNIIHYHAFHNIFKENTGKANFDDYFIKTYYSHELGLRKPDVEAFEEILKRENLVAEETLFVDDTAINIEGAKKAGLQVALLDKPKTVFNLSV